MSRGSVDGRREQAAGWAEARLQSQEWLRMRNRATEGRKQRTRAQMPLRGGRELEAPIAAVQ